MAAGDLIFLDQDDNQDFNAPTLTLDEIIDWNINEFNLDIIKSSIKTSDTKIITSYDTETESFNQDMIVSTPEEIEISRSKETSQKDFISVEMRIGISTYKLCIRIYIKNTSPENIIIFDDVFTTGSTTRSASNIFPAKTKIWIFTLSG